MRKLTVDDIADHRAYERERDEFRRHIIDLKRRRRIPLGELLSIVFENTDTMRWQVQEMARAERMLSDDAIAGEIATYNELIPDDGELSGTLFVELTDDDSLREWLPKFVGIQHHVHFELGDGAESTRFPRTRNGSRVTTSPPPSTTSSSGSRPRSSRGSPPGRRASSSITPTTA